MGDAYVWTGAETSTVAGGALNLDDPANWFDLTTNSVATHAPQTGDIAIFTADATGLVAAGTSDGHGGFIVTPTEFDPATLEIANGVHVGFGAFAGSTEYLMGTLEISSGGSFSLGSLTSMDATAADIGAGATLDLSHAFWIGAPNNGPPGSAEQNADRAASQLGYPGPLNAIVGALTLEQGGSVVLGDRILGVSQFVNKNEGTGNAFDPAAGISGAGQVRLPLTDVAMAHLTSQTLDFGTVTLGDTVSLTFTLANFEGDAALYPLIGALQTSANGASITDPDLSGTGVTPQDFSIPGRGGNETFTVTLTARHTGVLQGQAINLAYEFNNGTLDQNQLIPITGTVLAPTVTGSGNPSPCYVAGTRIATAAGEVAVERLRPGDLVCTAAGRFAPVVWMGLRRAHLGGAPEVACPVRITADALAPGVPRRDLLLSPDHAVMIEGCLIPAHRLVNGASIRRERALSAVDYVHVELDRHDLLLAEGMAAESYLDTSNRGQFDGEWGVRPLFETAPEDPLRAALDAYASRGCAPLHLGGEFVQRVHARLLARAKALGWRLTRRPALSATADLPGATQRCVRDGLSLVLPPGTRSVHLRSRSFVPNELDPAHPDFRRLGVAVALWLDSTPLPESAFASGWYVPEGGGAWRWSDGDGRLALEPRPGRTTLLIRVMPAGARYWRAPQPESKGSATTLPTARAA